MSLMNLRGVLIGLLSAIAAPCVAVQAQPVACCDVCTGGCVVVEDVTECLGHAAIGHSSCSPDPCIAQAACCLHTGVCVVMSIQECVSATFYGFILSSCGPDPCMGACCRFDGGCQMTTGNDCLGTWRGDRVCDPGACGGACCLPDQTCQTVADAEGCTLLNGAFVAQQACGPAVCLGCVGACCLPDGSCRVLRFLPCDDLGGEYVFAQTCEATNGCTGACCLPDGVCTLTLRSGCVDPDPPGTWIGVGTSCEVVSCNGACCRPDFSCTVSTSVLCQFPDNYLGDGSACEPMICNPPTGACCAVDGTCSIATECECVSFGGTIFIDTPCAPELCGENIVVGACCYGGKPETCSFTTEFSCFGSFNPGVACENAPCNYRPIVACCCFDSCIMVDEAQCFGTPYFNQSCAPDPCAAGACCDPLTGQCTALPYPSVCFGTYLPGQSCEPNPCPAPPTGACCDRDNDDCTVTTFLDCVNIRLGNYRGDNQPCTPSICASACCLPPVHGGLGSVCALRTRPDCAAAGGQHVGLYASCGFTFNPTVCCKANFNGFSGLTVQDLFDFLSAYFNGDPRADFNQSGSLSVQDQFDYLSAYFSGCRIVP
ncbi:MAG: GC-type dockerin domain-anchored protein [Phycisphaerales bacterium]